MEKTKKNIHTTKEKKNKKNRRAVQNKVETQVIDDRKKKPK